jgi:hypothetical protein
LSGKLNVDGRVSIPVVVDDSMDNIDGILRTNYSDIDIVFVIDTSIDNHNNVPEWISKCKRSYKVIDTVGPSKYTPHGWQLPLILGIGETTGEYTFICNQREQLNPDTITNMMNALNNNTVVCLADYDYNKVIREAIVNNSPMKWLNIPMLFRKDVYYRQMAYTVGQVNYYRYMQVRLWCEGDFTCMPLDSVYLPIESNDTSDIIANMLADGYNTEDILPGGKYHFEFSKYDMEDTSKDLCNRCCIEYKGILPFLKDINNA